MTPPRQRRAPGPGGVWRRSRCDGRRQTSRSGRCCFGGICCDRSGVGSSGTLYLPPSPAVAPFDGSTFTASGQYESSDDSDLSGLFHRIKAQFTFDLALAGELGTPGQGGEGYTPTQITDDGCLRGYSYNPKWVTRTPNTGANPRIVGSFTLSYLDELEQVRQATADLYLFRFRLLVNQPLWSPTATPQSAGQDIHDIVLELETPLRAVGQTPEDFRANGGLVLEKASGVLEPSQVALIIRAIYSPLCAPNEVSFLDIFDDGVDRGQTDGRVGDGMLASAVPLRTLDPQTLRGADSLQHRVDVTGSDFQNYLDSNGAPSGDHRIAFANMTFGVFTQYQTVDANDSPQTLLRFTPCPDWLALFPCDTTTTTACCDQGGPCGKIDATQPFRWQFTLQSFLAVADLELDGTGVFNWSATSGLIESTADAGTAADPECGVGPGQRAYGAGSSVNTDRFGQQRIATVTGVSFANDSWSASAIIEPVAGAGIAQGWRMTLEAGVQFNESPPQAVRTELGALRIVATATPSAGVVIEEATFTWNDSPTGSQDLNSGIELDDRVNPDPVDNLAAQIEGAIVGVNGSSLDVACLSSMRLFSTAGPMVDTERVGWLNDVGGANTEGKLRRIRIRLDVSNLISLLNMAACGPQRALLGPCSGCGKDGGL